MPAIDQLEILRCIKFSSNLQSVQLHGFCDARQNAYSVCIYVRSVIGPQECRSELLCSKSRVARFRNPSRRCHCRALNFHQQYY